MKLQFKAFLLFLLLLSFPGLLIAQQSNYSGTIRKDTLFERYLGVSCSGTQLLQFNKDGNVSSLVENLINPSGLVLIDSIAYVAENQHYIKGYLLKNGSKIFEVNIPQTSLNGLTSTGDSLLFTADTTGNKLIKININNSVIEVLTEIPKIKDLEYDSKNNNIIICTEEKAGRVLIYSFLEKETSTLFTMPEGYGVLESLEVDTLGNIFISTYDHIFQCSEKDGYKLHEIIQCLNSHVYLMLDYAENKILVPKPDWSKLFKYNISEFYIKQQIVNQFDLMVKYFNENKMLSIANIYDDDAYILDPNTTFHGRKQIEDYWKPLQNNGESWILENKIIDSSLIVIKCQTLYEKMRNKPRDWSILNVNTSGAYYMLGVSKLKEKGGSQYTTDFILVWKKDLNGKWKILVDSYVPEDLLTSIKTKEFKVLRSFPNPAKESINFQFYIDKVSPVKLEIFDLNGNQIKILIYNNLNPGEYKIKFSTENLTNGIYCSKLSTGIKSETIKFIVKK